MNKKVPFILVALSSIALTACDAGIKQEKFVEQLNKVKDNIALTSDALDNVHIQENSSLNQTNYKEGEFYSKVSGLVLTRVVEYVWKEGDKFYHYKKSLIQTVDTEIDETAFTTLMATYRGKICEELNMGVIECENLLKDEPETYKNVQNKFYKTFEGQYRMNSTMTAVTLDENNNEVESERKVMFLIKKGLPAKFTTKTDSETKYSYSFGNAKFTAPERNTNN